MDPAAAGETGAVVKRKLIEVSLPLEAINRESAREKSIRHGHPSTLHLWWARRPLAAARAVLFAQLVDDPSSHPDRFPTEADQRRERERLHGIIERLVVWENIRDEKLLAEAHAEILASTDGNPPPILDPFAGGGTIPLEAQRLGLEAHASDLNPVAVLINKALIEIPPKFRNQPPVAPGLANSRLTPWRGAEGLAADVRYYGEWMRDEAKKRIGHLYPDAVLADGSKAPVIAWIWARTVTCPNPACGIEMPLVRSWWLGKKKGKEAYVVPQVVRDHSHPSGQRVEFSIGHESSGPDVDGTMSGRQGATCLACGSSVSKDHIKGEGQNGRMGAALLSVVAEGNRQRIYLAPTPLHARAADLQRPDHVPDQELGFDPRNLWTPQYGLTKFADLFTNRQLVALTTFSDLVGEARERVLTDALAAGLPAGDRLEARGTGAAAYADAVATYLGMCLSKLTVANCSLARWRSDADKSAPAFGRQAIAMVWDFAEVSPFAGAGGDWLGIVEAAGKTLLGLPRAVAGVASQRPAQSASWVGRAVSTDPPYYDNIGYSDLSDFAYVWLRRSIRELFPLLLSTVLVPKSEELVANPYRQGGADSARRFFEIGFRNVFAQARVAANPEIPMTVYYAFKQSESAADGESSPLLTWMWWLPGVVWEGGLLGAAGEQDEGEGGVGGVEAAGSVDDESGFGVEGFVAAVVHAVVEGGGDAGAVGADGAGGSHELGDLGSAGSGTPPGQQVLGLVGVQVTGEHGPQRFFEVVAADDLPALSAQGGQGDCLGVGQVGLVLQQRPPGALVHGGQVLVR